VSLDGFLNLHKPLGWTSHDCVVKVRRLLRQKWVGHGGTLDPAASGVLPIALGKATRLLPYLPTGKAYRATILLGVTTDTDDLEGTVVATFGDRVAHDPVERTGHDRDNGDRDRVGIGGRSPRSLTLTDIQAALAHFQGTITQVPPQYSAIQVDGKRLYDRARAGEAVVVPSRQVTIAAIKILAWRSLLPTTQSRLLAASHPSAANLPFADLQELEVTVTCGPGTYIRALARDLGNALGTGGTLAALVRTQSCGFSLSASLTLEMVAQQVATGTFQPLPVGMALAHLPAIVLPMPWAKRWCQGQKLPIAGQPPEAIATCDTSRQVHRPSPAAHLDGDHLPLPVDIPTTYPNQALPASAIVRVEDAQGRILGIGAIQTGQVHADPVVASRENSLDNAAPDAIAVPTLLTAKVVLVNPEALTTPAAAN